MSDMDALNAQIEAGVAKSQHRDTALEILESACEADFGLGIAKGEIVIYTGLADNDTDAQNLLMQFNIIPSKEDS